MSWKRKLHGSSLGFIGFMLSPLSWWNDAIINLPLAIGFGWLVALFYKPAFEVAVVVGYWLTNVLGFILMHHGIQKVASSTKPKPYSWISLRRDILISLLYTALIVILLKLGLLKPFTEYLNKN